MTELFSLWGLQKGWLLPRRGGYQVSADFGNRGIWYIGTNLIKLEEEFNRTCRRAFLRRLVPCLPPPPVIFVTLNLNGEVSEESKIKWQRRRKTGWRDFL